jgi:hypothetical protein
MYDEMHMG